MAMGYNVCCLPEEGFKTGFGPTGVLDLPEERVGVEWYSKEKEIFSPASAAAYQVPTCHLLRTEDEVLPRRRRRVAWWSMVS